MGRVVGQRAVVEGLLAAYMARGHVLVEGLPGVGKTLALGSDVPLVEGSELREAQTRTDASDVQDALRNLPSTVPAFVAAPIRW